MFLSKIVFYIYLTKCVILTMGIESTKYMTKYGFL